MGEISNQASRRIQILRGVAILAVVLIHNTPLGMWQVVCRPFLNFAVGAFLFLSGMLSCPQRWNPRKRILKVLIPYAIWTLVYVVMDNFRAPAAIPMEYIKRLILADGAAVMYYVFVYIQFTLLVPLLHKIALSKYKYLPFLIAPVEVLLLRLLPTVLGLELHWVFLKIQSVSCLPWFSFFYLGYLLGNGLLESKTGTAKLVAWLAAAVVLQWLEGYCYYRMGDANCGTQVKLSVLLTTGVFLLLAYRFITGQSQWDSRVLRLLGDHSFGIYFSHLAVMWVLKKIPAYGQLAVYPLNGLLAAALSLLCCMLGRRLLGRLGKYLAL